MQLFSISLIEKEIKELERIENPEEFQRIMLYQYKRELAVLRHIHPDSFNFLGTIEEVEKRYKDASLFIFENENEYIDLLLKANAFDVVNKTIKERGL